MNGQGKATDRMQSAQDAAELLLIAWRDPTKAVPALPGTLKPEDETQAYAIQQATMAALGPIGGWKVGASGPGTDAVISCAPMPKARMREGSAQLPSAVFTQRMVEAEICFRMKQDLGGDGLPVSRQQVIDAIGSCHVGIEILQSRFQDADAQDRLSGLADCIFHGAYLVGPEVANWRDTNWNTEEASVFVDGQEKVRHVANPAGEMIRLVQWLANKGALWAGGLKAGQIVTCGSWTGKTPVGSAGVARIHFSTAGEMTVTFTP